jgi:cation diffusion facilitator CzcD-associated flavoprotein CzcO
MMKNSCQFTVIGAGPYGMATASHLRAAGAEVRIFGQPMEFWDRQMPKGMLLRSPWPGSNIGDPRQALTLDRYEEALGSQLERRLPIEDFVRYGQWFQRRALSDLDPRNVASLERDGDGYRITLDDGEQFCSDNVVAATGIGSFANRPAPFTSLTEDLVSHTSHPLNSNLGRFRDKCVVVVGAGQSAIESAALLHEAGAEVEVLVRRPQLRWLSSSPLIEGLVDSKMNPFKAPGKIGPIGMNWLVEHPALFTAAPRRSQDAMMRRAMRPAASAWLHPRACDVRITTDRHAMSAVESAGKVHLRLNDHSERMVDHVLLGTGYRIDVTRTSFLSAELRQSVRTENGFPVLSRAFESSQSGLYFVGAPAAYSFGPLVRFVAGTRFAASTLSRYAVGVRRRRVFGAFLERPQLDSSVRGR